MVYKQIKTYLQNEDFSAISFSRFKDGQTEKFPTYTVCFEDNFIHQIFKLEHIGTSNMYYSEMCHNGCDIKLEKNRLLLLLNKTYYEHDHLPQHDYPAYDYPAYDYFFLNGSYGYDYYHSTSWNETTEAETESIGNNQTDKTRFKRTMDIYEAIEKDGIWSFDLNGLGKPMVLLKSEEKIYVIAPMQYQYALMGLNKALNYSFETPYLNGTGENVELNYAIADIQGFLFNNTVFDLEEFVYHFHFQTGNGSIVGWNTDAYKKIETFCEARNIVFGYGGRDCNVEDSMRDYLESMTPSNYPFEKVYQDPLKVCYAPKMNIGQHRKSEQLTLDLQKMFFEYDQKFRRQSVVSFMKVYIHMDGQFIRKIGKESASYTGKDVTVYCKKFPFLYDEWGVTVDAFPPLHERFQCEGTRISFDISQVTLLKSRHDAKTTCNVDLEDEDAKIMETLMNDESLGCVPLYWRGFNNIGLRDQCNETSQYKYISQETSNFTNFEKFRKRFEPPCEEMIIVTNIQIKKGREVQQKDFNGGIDGTFNGTLSEDEIGLYLDLQFSNVNDRYQIIENNRGFTGESCWAGIGGFVGIFIGISLMQVPEILLSVFNFLKKMEI
jgi:hypothetical protein